ncbi:hypothetical protein ABZ960_20235 [Streptomyces pseudovenezuelae]|uniref:hypothetical protein n=1 Tax=Streptomyces pseudovenezuelae TaxID=67350 RepID=UPI0034A1B79A
MSPNQKRALAVVIAALVSAIIGLVASICLDNMVESASGWACLALGCGVFVTMFLVSVAVIGLFEFSDSRPQQGQPNPPGAPVS